MLIQTPVKSVTPGSTLKRIVLGVLLVFLSIFSIFIANLGNHTSYAATASTINFQARLMGSAGQLVNDGNYHVEFKLFNASSSSGSSQGSCSGDAACLWTETRTTGNLVTVKNGYLTVNLGSVTSFPGTINWDQDLWLTMNIGGSGGAASWDGEMSPRLKLTAVPYAFRAGQLAKLTGANTSTLDFATQTTANSILLPNAGGTLAIATGGSFTNNGVLYGNGTTSIQATGAGTTGQCLVATTGSAPTFGSCAGTGSGATLQAAYDNSSPASILLATAKDLTVTSPDVATDPSVVINLQCTTCSASGGRFAVQNGGTDAFVVNPNNAGISIGTTTGSNALTLRTGTGNFSLDGVAGSTYTIGATTVAGTITIGGTGQTGAITLGSSTGTNIVNLGTGTGSTTVNIATGVTNAKTVNIGTGAAMANGINIGGTGANVIALGNTQTAGSISLGAAMTTGTINIGGTGLQTGTINLGVGTGAQAINLGTGGTGAKTVTVGSLASTGLTTLQAGTGGVLVKPVNSTTAFQVQDASSTNLFTVDSLNQQVIIGITGTSTPVGQSFPGTGTADANTPDSLSNSVSGDIDLIAKIQPNDWTPPTVQTIISKYAATNSQYSYNFSIGATTGRWTLGLSNSGTAATTATASTNAGFINGTAHWVRATWVASTGVVQFFRSEDGTTWTQVGSNQTISNVTVPSIFDSNANLNVGAAATANNTLVFTGTIYRAKVYSGLSDAGGTLAADYNPSDASSLTSTSWASSTSGETWTINGTTTRLSSAAGTTFTPTLSTVGTQALYRNLSDSTTAFQIQDSVGTNILSVDSTTRRIGIGTATPTAKLHLVGAGTTDNALLITPGAAQTTADLVKLDNTGFPVVTAGANNLQITYVGGAAAVEAGAQRIDITPGTTTGGTWNGLRIVQNATGPATGVTSNGVKLEGPTAGGAGTYNAINVANIGAVTTSGTVNGLNITGTNSQAAGTVNGININNLTPGAASETAIKIGTGWDTSLLLNTSGAQKAIQVTATGAPTSDLVNISNSGQINVSDQVNGLQLDYYSALANAAHQASAVRVNITNTSSVAGSTTNGIRIVPTANVSGNTNGLAIDAITSSATATDSAIKIGAGWDNILQSSTVNISGTGVITGATGITSSGTITFNGLPATAGIVTNTSGGVLGTTNAVAANLGGTGFNSYAVGDLLFANTTSTLAKLSDVATGSCLVSGGINTAPAWGACTAGVTYNNGITNTAGTVQLGGNLVQNTTIGTGNSFGLNVTSDLAAGARSADAFTISQADNVTNDSTGSLLRINNLDTGSTAAALNVSTASSNILSVAAQFSTPGNGIAVNITGVTNGVGVSANTITSGNGLNGGGTLTTGSLVNANLTGTGLTSGSVLSASGSASGALSAYTGALINVTPTRTNTATTGTLTDSGNFLNLTRSSTQNGAGGTFAITGALANLQSNCTQTAGTCTDSANILGLNQQYANASGAVLNVQGAGTGNLGILDATNASANGVSIDVQSSSSSQYAFKVTSNNGSTNGLYVRADGNVGIGTTSPTNLLSVKGSGVGVADIGQLSDATAYGAIGFTPGGTLSTTNYALAGTQVLTILNAPTSAAINLRIGNANKVIIDSSGNVGIGTSGSLATLLAVGGTTGNFTVASTGAVTSVSTLQGTVLNATTGFQVAGGATTGNYLRGNGTNFVSAAIQAGDIPDLGASYIKNQTGLQSSSNFRISGIGIADTALLAGYTSVTGGVAAFNGNVGIGTSSPNIGASSGNFRVLTVAGQATSGGGVLELSNSANTASAGQSLGSIRGYNGSTLVANIGIQNAGTDSGVLLFSTAPVGGGVTERARITANGDLGLGTSSPSAKLHVSQVNTGVTPANLRGIQISTDNAETSASTANEVTGLYNITRITATNNQNNTSSTGVSSYIADVRTVAGATGTISNVQGINVLNLINAGDTVLTNVHGLKVVAATNTGAGSITKLSGISVADQSAGTNNTNLLLGTTTIPTGNYSIYNSSAYNNYFAGNVGIGTSTPDTKLDIAGSSLNSTSSVNHYRNVVSYSASGAVTGTMKIALPKTWSSTMMTANIRGYDYSANAEWEVIISGYNYSGTPAWLNYSAQIKGSAPFTQVRLAHDGTNNVILLGTTTTAWSYPKVEVTDFIATFGSITGWGSGWSIAPITVETGITNIVTPTIPTYINSSGNYGIGTTSPGQRLDVQGGNINTSGALMTGGATRLSSTGVLSNITGYTQTSGSATFNQSATDILTVTSGATAPTTDMVVIDSSGAATATASVNNLNLKFKGSTTTAVENGSLRVDLTPGTFAGSTTNGLRVALTAAPAASTTSNGFKLDAVTTGGAGTYNGLLLNGLGTLGAGTETAINVQSNWDSVLTVGANSILNGSGILQSAGLSGTYSNALTFSNASNSFTGVGTGLTALNGSNISSGTVAVGVGGTGIVTTTAYGLLTGGTTATGAFQNAGTGSTGNILKSNGAAALPTWVTNTQANVCSDCVQLQSSTPGTPQTGNFNISGTGIIGAALGVGGAPSDTFSVTTPSLATDITLGLRTATAGGASTRSIFTQGAATGALTLAVDQGQNGSTRALIVNVGAATNALYVNASGNVGLGTATPTTFKLEVAGNIGPEADNTRDLGSTGRRFLNVFASNLDTVSAGTISLGNTNASTINIAANNATHAIHIGDGATGVNSTTIGTTNSTSTTNIQGGTGASAVTIQSGAAGTLSVGANAVANTIQIGTVTTNTGNTQAINIGNINVAGTTNVTIGSGASATAGTTTLQSKGTLALGNAISPTVNIQSASAGAINVGNNAVANTIQVGINGTNTGNTQTINIGNQASAGTTNVTIGAFTGATAGNTTVQAFGTLGLQTAASGTINIGTNAVTGKTVNVGSIGSTANTTSILVGTSTGAAQTVQIGGTGLSSGSNASTTVAVQGGATNLSVANGGATIQNFTTAGSATAFQVQNAGGAPVFLVDTTTTNLITNPGFEVNTTGWSGSGTGASIAQNLTASKVYFGLSSLRINTASSGTTTATVNGFTSTLTAGTYTFSFYAMADNAITLGSTVTFTGGGGTCTLNNTSILTTGYQRYSCTVTTSGTTTAISFTTATNSAVGYIDSVQLTLSPSVTPYKIGAVQLRGVVTNPTSFQSTSNSTTAFQIQNASGTSNLFVADTLNNRIGIGTSAPAYSLDVVGDINSSTGLRVGGNLVCTSVGCTSSSNLQDAYNASTGSTTPEIILNNGGTSRGVDIQNDNSSPVTGSLFAVRSNTASGLGSALFSVDNTGTSLFNQASTNDIAQFGNGGITKLKVDTSGNILGANAAGSTGTTTGTGASTTTLVLTTDAFNVNDVVFIDNAGQDYYTRITADPGTGSYTVSPAITFETGRTVTKYTIQNIGATATDYSTQSNRLFQGYFLGGVVTGAGSTTYSDGMISSSVDLVARRTTDSTNAFAVQSAAGTNLVSVDSTNLAVVLGTNVNLKPVGSPDESARTSNIASYSVSANNTDIVRDGSGFPVVAYYEVGRNYLVLIHCNDVNCAGGNENTNTVDSTSDVGYGLSMVLDGSGFPVITYYDSTNLDLKIVHCNDANCAGGNETTNIIYSSITSLGSAGTSLKLDGSGKPMIAFSRGSNQLNYMHCDDVNCAGTESTSVLDTQAGYWPSMRLDSSGFPVISYYDGSGDDLELVHCNDADCLGGNENMNTVDSTGDVGSYSSLALDASGFPVIAYTDATNSRGKLTHCNDVNCAGANETTNNINASSMTSLDMELDGSGFPVMAAKNGFNPTLVHCNDVNCAGANETTNSLDSTFGLNPNFYALTLDGSGFPIVSIGEDYTGLKVNHCSDANCATGNLNSIVTGKRNMGEGNGYTRMVLDSSGFPVFAYYEFSGKDLVVVHCNDTQCAGANENENIVDSTGDVGNYLSLQLDSSGFPVISYYGATSSDLKLAHCNDVNCAGGNENVNIVDSAVNGGQFTSLLLDSSGFPVISYYDISNSSLKLAHCNDVNCAGSNETLNTVDNTAQDGVRTDLALDSSGFPVIFYNESSVGMKLTHCNDVNCAGANETTNTIEANSSNGYQLSLRLDSSGFPVVSYSAGSGSVFTRVVHCDDVNCVAAGNSSATLTSSTGGSNNQLVLDASGYPVVIDGAKLYRCSDASCSTFTTATILSGGEGSISSGLVLDSNNLPKIAVAAVNTYVINCVTTDCIATLIATGGSSLGSASNYFNEIYAFRFYGRNSIISSFDVAENYNTTDSSISEGDIVSVDVNQTLSNGQPDAERFVSKTSKRYQSSAIGAVSTKPGLLLADWSKKATGNERAVALVGRVPVKVNNQNGEIVPGDPITTSDTPGVGMKAKAAGRIIGYAMEGFGGDKSGKILVFINPSYYVPQNADGLAGSALFSELNISDNTLIGGKLEVAGNIQFGGHLLSKASNAPKVEKAVAAGQDAEITLDGTDTAGTITIKVKAHATTGDTPPEVLVAGDLTTLTFHTPFELTPRVIITATNDQAVGLPVYVTKTKDGFKLVIKTAATDGAEYTFDYFVIGSATKQAATTPSTTTTTAPPTTP